MENYQIGKVTQRLGISADTLRYYEKINLIPKVARNGAGIRYYTDKDLSRLRFIKRAQAMNFSLSEIGDLLKMRDNPAEAQQKVREMTYCKLNEVKERLHQLQTLYHELQLLVNLCTNSEGECPIIDSLDLASPSGNDPDP